jgi:hypothetical protein
MKGMWKMYTNGSVRRALMTVVPVLVWLAGASGTCSGAPWGVDCGLTLVSPDQYNEVVIHYPVGGPPPNVHFETSDHRVDLDGLGGYVFDVSWSMHLINIYLDQPSGENLIDQDFGGTVRITLPTNGHWEHLAHDTGTLQGDINEMPTGNYKTTADVRIDATRVNYTPSQYATYSVEKGWSIVSP